MGAYEVERLLGHGTYANVWAGREVQTGQPVAIKDIKKFKLEDQGQEKVSQGMTLSYHRD